MAQYSFLSKQGIKSIFNKYAITDIISYKILSGGSENTNYLVSSHKKKYVLTVFEQKTVNRVRQLSQFLNHLEKNDYSTTRVVPTMTGEYLILWQSKPVIVKHFIEGKIIKNLSNHSLELIGIEIARLHGIEAPEYIPKYLDFGIEQFTTVALYAANSAFEAWLADIQDYIKPYLQINLPKSIIHSDVFYNNVIVSHNESLVTIVDFEEATHYYRIFDIGMAIIGLCAEKDIINLEKVKHLLKGYMRKIHLEEKELKSLQAFTVYAGAAMTFWRHKNFNYINPDTRLSHHYKDLQVLTDYMRVQPAGWFL